MRAKILIVDDDRDILLGLENRITWMGHEPVTADNGKDALRLLEQGELDLAVLGDCDKLEQILWNLIGNASKFTPPGGRIIVDFQTTPEGFVQTSVADTGCGIDQEHIEKLFTEFSKVPSALPTAQGAQLGLFITKSLVTMHGGTIWVESTAGVGTRFYFTLPIASSRAEG